MITIVALHIYYIHKFVQSPDKGVAIVTPILFRQAESLFSLFSASSPPINQYLREFRTTDLATFGYTPGGSYNLTSVSSRARRLRAESDLPTLNGRFAVPGQGSYQVIVESGGNHGAQCIDLQNDGSHGRSDGNEMIIRRDATYEIAWSDAQ